MKWECKGYWAGWWTRHPQASKLKTLRIAPSAIAATTTTRFHFRIQITFIDVSESPTQHITTQRKPFAIWHTQTKSIGKIDGEEKRASSRSSEQRWSPCQARSLRGTLWYSLPYPPFSICCLIRVLYLFTFAPISCKALLWFLPYLRVSNRDRWQIVFLCGWMKSHTFYL